MVSGAYCGQYDWSNSDISASFGHFKTLQRFNACRELLRVTLVGHRSDRTIITSSFLNYILVLQSHYLVHSFAQYLLQVTVYSPVLIIQPGCSGTESSVLSWRLWVIKLGHGVETFCLHQHGWVYRNSSPDHDMHQMCCICRQSTSSSNSPTKD